VKRTGDDVSQDGVASIRLANTNMHCAPLRNRKYYWIEWLSVARTDNILWYFIGKNVRSVEADATSVFYW